MNTNLVSIVTDLAEKLNVQIPHMYNVVVQQSYIDGITYIISFIATYCGLALVIRYFTNKLSSTDSEEPNREPFTVLYCVSWALVGLATFILIMHINTIFTCFANPEYHAFTLMIGK